MEGGILGGEIEESPNIPLWPYVAELGGLPPYKYDTQGFPDRLYFMFTLTPEMPETEQWFSLKLEDCPEPILAQAVILPAEPPENKEKPAGCHAGLNEDNCRIQGGMYYRINDNLSICFCP
jgi:hypothetical protein